MDEEQEDDLVIDFLEEKTTPPLPKGSKMDNLINIINNQTDLLHWLSQFEMPDQKGKGDLYDAFIEHKIKVTGNAMKLIMRCQTEFAKISKEVENK